MVFEELAELLFPHVKETPQQMEDRYPKRDLPQDAMVTRIAPSPTGYMHLGGLFGALIDERMAHQSSGVFYLRIEDTDDKREVPGAVESIITICDHFGLAFDEGATVEGDKGAYGPYRQRSREAIYKVFAKELVRKGRAYPCFCTPQELSEAHEKQEQLKENFGYYGKWAVHRDQTLEQIKENLVQGKSFVLRFRSLGDASRTVTFRDEVKGELNFPENDQDFVLLKSDGIPTYHFAHVVDDHLMRTTHVVRGEEWLATLPWHLELFKALEFPIPKYCHTAQVMKQEGDSKRKLSKRKDPEAALEFYTREGYPTEALIEYMMMLLNSNFEEWRIANPDSPLSQFFFSVEKLGTSGALFDLVKFRDVSKNVISRYNEEEMYKKVTDWAKDNDKELFSLLTRDQIYAAAIFAIGRGGSKPRKDLAAFCEVKEYFSFFYEELYSGEFTLPENITAADANEILARYLSVYNEADEQTIWFEKIRSLSAELGFSPDVKAYKKNPDGFKGHVGDVSGVLRMAITGRQNSPDLYQIMQILGKDRVVSRIQGAMSKTGGAE